MKRGFTLIEMMVVVAIIAILVGMAVPQYQKNVRKAEATDALRFAKSIIDASVTYKSAHGKYYAGDSKFTKPTTSEYTTIGINGMSTGDKVIRVLAVDRETLNNSKFVYRFAVNSTGDRFWIRAKEDSKGGGSNDTLTDIIVYIGKSLKGISNYDDALWDGNSFTSAYINDVDSDPLFTKQMDLFGK